MKIIFLDIDGVLVNRESLIKQSGRHAKGHPDCVMAFNKIIEATKANVVISSVWRSFGVQKMRILLREWGVKSSVIDCTPQLESMVNGLYISPSRGAEIQAWLDKNPCDDFIIIDDDRDMIHLMPRLIQTKFEIGLTMQDADKAIELFQ
ncbi:MAG: HAD domain-containing protein [Candidatus Brocadiaceae bacterium]|nr:HAD domain-containing protein [Candidatus Brocadiaceae bacterium]